MSHAPRGSTVRSTGRVEQKPVDIGVRTVGGNAGNNKDESAMETNRETFSVDLAPEVRRVRISEFRRDSFVRHAGWPVQRLDFRRPDVIGPAGR
ncbi:hypothetical protein IU450_22935 [Nocardia abscessus]|uniref:hypothetical protein n=1 Tax=Nocardia abscessus TaxID=120957 RepID=UPI001892DDDF|nr:hypothetical protein [Nocardia abscessus]MBF6338729.1 hypothetical protein [Nocardia abscessus]